MLEPVFPEIAGDNQEKVLLSASRSLSLGRNNSTETQKCLASFAGTLEF